MENFCCHHQELIFVKNQCSGYIKYVSPCCVHGNTVSKRDTCLETKFFTFLLFLLLLFIFLSAAFFLIWIVSQLNGLLSPIIQLSTVTAIISFGLYWLERIPRKYLVGAIIFAQIMEYLASILF